MSIGFFPFFSLSLEKAHKCLRRRLSPSIVAPLGAVAVVFLVLFAPPLLVFLSLLID